MEGRTVTFDLSLFLPRVGDSRRGESSSDKQSIQGWILRCVHGRTTVRLVLGIALAVVLGGMAGCSKPPTPRPLEYSLVSPYRGMHTLAVAPAINVSGKREFDPLTVSDTMFVELQQVHGLTVLPVNKTIAAMQHLRVRSIDSPETAARIAQVMGADGLVIMAVTAYDPYMPPTVGMKVQLYTVRDADEVVPVEPTTQVRRMDGSMVDPPAPAATEAGATRHLAATISAVFNSSNQSVRIELKDFARGRTDYDSALQEEKFLADADAYMRFVCHAMVRRLMEVERSRGADR